MRQQPNHLLAIKPIPAVATHIDALRDQHGIDRSYAPAKLHTTLAPLGADQRIVDRLLVAMRGFRAAPFRVVFDRIEHASLKASETIHGLADFHRNLLLHLGRNGETLPGYSFRPHITLSYADRLPGAFDIDPVSWRVEEFLLIESFAGRHRPIVRWRLA